MDSYQSGESAREAEFQRLSQTVSSNIQKIIQNVSSMQRMVRQLGTPQDNESLRSQLHQIQHYTNQLAKDTHRSCRELDALSPPTAPSTQRQWKLQRERLTNDFTSALTNFQAAQRSAAECEREEMRRARAESASRIFDDPAAPTVQPRTDLLQDQVVADEEERIRGLRERESAVRQLEDDIRDVNQIFRDLATMVHDQGEVIDSIEAHVEETHGSVQQGTQQLSRASDYQNRARRKKLCLLVVGVVVLAIIIAIVVSNSN
uniref:Syntaxin 7-like protein n=1 Tax=Parasacculina yatsui TaxID=2836420 RepID=A0A8K1VCG0_9CRUS|nr:syntaxin 7-like protein [Parasacculina yatsui]